MVQWFSSAIRYGEAANMCLPLFHDGYKYYGGLFYGVLVDQVTAT